MTYKLNDNLALILTALIGLGVPIIILKIKGWGMIVSMSLGCLGGLIWNFCKIEALKSYAKRKNSFYRLVLGTLYWRRRFCIRYWFASNAATFKTIHISGSIPMVDFRRIFFSISCI